MDEWADVSYEVATERLTALVEQLVAARDAVTTAQRRVAAISKMIEAHVELYPALEDLLPQDFDAEEPRPRGAEAVFEVLPREWRTVPGVLALLENRGWAPVSVNPANAVRTALERLVAAKRIEKARSTQNEVIYRKPDIDDEEPF